MSSCDKNGLTKPKGSSKNGLCRPVGAADGGPSKNGITKPIGCKEQGVKPGEEWMSDGKY